MLEGQLGVRTIKKEEEHTTSVYQSSHNTLPTLLGQGMLKHTCIELIMRLQGMLIDLFTQSSSTMSCVLCVTLQHEKLL